MNRAWTRRAALVASSDAKSVVFAGVGKVFGGATAALSGTSIFRSARRSVRHHRPQRRGQVHAAAAVNGLKSRSSGEVRVNGVSVGALDERGLVALRRRIGMVFQHFNLLSAKRCTTTSRCR